MKKAYSTILFILFSLIASAASYKGHISFEITKLEYAATTVDIALQIRLIGEVVDKCESKVLFPVVETYREVYTYPYLLISGNNKRHMYKRWYTLTGKKQDRNYIDQYTEVNGSKNEDTVITYELQVPKEEWTKGARLILREEVIGCANEMYTMDYLIQEAILREEAKELPVLPTPQPEKPAIQIHQKDNEVFYHVNRHVIDFSYKNNQEEARQIVELINNSSLRIKAINLIGYASPEGPYHFNENLAMQRAISVKKYIHQHTSINEEVVNISWVAENWKGLLELLKTTDIPNKYGVISIIENNVIPQEERNNYIRLIDNGVTYNYLLKEFYPLLRKVECHIYYETYTTSDTNRNLQIKEFSFY